MTELNLTCINCGRPRRKGFARCDACRSYRQKYNAERPLEMALRQDDKRLRKPPNFLHCPFDVFLTEYLPRIEAAQGIQWPDALRPYDVFERGRRR